MSLPDIFTGRKFVEHLIANDEVLPIQAIKFDYLLGGNGLFIRAKRTEFSVCLPLFPFQIKGLPKVSREIIWHKPRIPNRIWQEILANARSNSNSAEFREEVYIVYWQEEIEKWQWKNIGKQRTYASTVADDTFEEYGEACFELHTHPPKAIHFSQADDNDEQGKFRLFGILTDLHGFAPQARFRCGIYDYFVPILASEVGEMPPEIVDLTLIEQAFGKE